jgi:hypothetical protein
LFKENIMKLTTKLIFVAAASVLAASSAFAQFNGLADSDSPMKPLSPQATPASVPASASSADNQSGDSQGTNVSAAKVEKPVSPPYQGEHDHAW